MLGPDRTCDGRASWVLLLLWGRIEYSCATLFHKLYDLGGGHGPLGSKDILDILGIRGYLHSVKKRYVDIKLIYYLDKLAELLISHRHPYPFRKQ